MNELRALRDEAGAMIAFGETIPADGWDRPSRCTLLNVRDLYVHVASQMEWLARVEVVDAQPEKDRYSWWDYDIDEDQEEVATSVAEESGRFAPGPLTSALREHTHAAVRAAEALAPHGDLVVRAGAGTIRLSDYVATRVLEVTIHAMDVRDAFGLPPAATPAGLAITGDIMRTLLGADLRAAGVSDEHLALFGSGRGGPTPSELAALGSLAEKLPLFA